MNTTLDLVVADGVATLTLVADEPRRPPTFDHPTLDALDARLTEVAARLGPASIRLLFIRSASPRFFCAGANLNALQTINADTIGAWVAHGHEVFARLEDLPIPTVARVEGFALGGGLELALACDLIFARDTAELGQTEAALGFVAGWGGSMRLPRRVGVARAKELFFSARRVPAAAALTYGLIDFCGDADALAAHCDDFASAVKSGSARSHAEHKRLVDAAAGRSRADGARAEADASVACLRDSDTAARLRHFLHARK